MSITTHHVIQYLKTNSIQLIEDGILLLTHKRYSRSYLCFQAAIDEMNKCMQLEQAEKKAPINWQKIDIELVNEPAIFEKDIVIEQAIVRYLELEFPAVSLAQIFDYTLNLKAEDFNETYLIERIDPHLQTIMFEEKERIEALILERNTLRASLLQVQITKNHCVLPSDAISQNIAEKMGLAAIAMQLML